MIISTLAQNFFFNNIKDHKRHLNGTKQKQNTFTIAVKQNPFQIELKQFCEETIP